MQFNHTNIEFGNTYRYLGLLFYDKLTMLEQAKQTLYTVPERNNTLKYIQHYIDGKTAILIYKTSILQIFEYGNFCNCLMPSQYRLKYQRTKQIIPELGRMLIPNQRIKFYSSAPSLEMRGTRNVHFIMVPCYGINSLLISKITICSPPS